MQKTLRPSNQAIEELYNLYFEFKPGDVVALRVHEQIWKSNLLINKQLDKFERANIPNGASVITRVLEQCHGGFQGFYTIRMLDHAEHSIRVADHELVPYEAIEAIAIQMREAGNKP